MSPRPRAVLSSFPASHCIQPSVKGRWLHKSVNSRSWGSMGAMSESAHHRYTQITLIFVTQISEILSRAPWWMNACGLREKCFTYSFKYMYFFGKPHARCSEYGSEYLILASRGSTSVYGRRQTHEQGCEQGCKDGEQWEAGPFHANIPPSYDFSKYVACC